MCELDIYVIQNITEYLDIDTLYITQRVNKRFNNTPITPINTHDVIGTGALIGSHKIINYAISTGNRNWNSGLFMACRGGNMDICNLMISKGADDWNMGLCGACNSDNLEIVNLMISHGACEWNWGLRSACEYGKLNMVNFMISKGADAWESALYNACNGCYDCGDISQNNSERINIINLLITKIGIICNWNWILKGACRGGNIDIVNLIISKGANNWDIGLGRACLGNFHCAYVSRCEKKTFTCHHTVIVNLMLSKGATQCDSCHRTADEHRRNIDYRNSASAISQRQSNQSQL